MEEQTNIVNLREEDITNILGLNNNETTVIPENSSTYLIDETTSRFNGAEWFKEVKNSKVTLAGLGGIGSYVAFFLSRIKPKRIRIYDFDEVESTNLSGQLYSVDDVGKYKVNALYNLVCRYSDYYDVITNRCFFEKFSDSDDIMICGFDNMAARKTFFESWLNRVKDKEDEIKNKCLYIDGRLSAESFQILCIQGDDEYNIKRYQEEFLFTDEEADSTICSYKQTSFCAGMIGAYIVNLFTNFIANQCNPIFKRDLPFFTEYKANLVYLKTEH